MAARKNPPPVSPRSNLDARSLAMLPIAIEMALVAELADILAPRASEQGGQVRFDYAWEVVQFLRSTGPSALAARSAREPSPTDMIANVVRAVEVASAFAETPLTRRSVDAGFAADLTSRLTRRVRAWGLIGEERLDPTARFRHPPEEIAGFFRFFRREGSAVELRVSVFDPEHVKLDLRWLSYS